MLTPVADGVAEGDETVVVTLLDDVALQPGLGHGGRRHHLRPADAGRVGDGIRSGCGRGRARERHLPLHPHRRPRDVPDRVLRAQRLGHERHRLRQHRRHGDLQHRPGNHGSDRRAGERRDGRRTGDGDRHADRRQQLRPGRVDLGHGDDRRSAGADDFGRGHRRHRPARPGTTVCSGSRAPATSASACRSPSAAAARPPTARTTRTSRRR